MGLKTPADYLNDFTQAKAQLYYLEKEYKDKVKGEVYIKRKSYFNNKILMYKKILANYCQTETVIYRTWTLHIERLLKDNIVKQEVVSINLDKNYSEDEVTRLVQFNLNCMVTQISTNNKLIRVGQITYL